MPKYLKLTSILLVLVASGFLFVGGCVSTGGSKPPSCDFTAWQCAPAGFCQDIPMYVDGKYTEEWKSCVRPKVEKCLVDKGCAGTGNKYYPYLYN